MCVQVIVLQAYKNFSKKPIEAKYVFPLDDMAAGTHVCVHTCVSEKVRIRVFDKIFNLHQIGSMVGPIWFQLHHSTSYNVISMHFLAGNIQ